MLVNIKSSLIVIKFKIICKYFYKYRKIGTTSNNVFVSTKLGTNDLSAFMCYLWVVLAEKKILVKKV